MTIIRLPNWRSRLSDHLAAIAGSAFAYGEHDCALFAADCVAAMTGIDLAAKYRGLYRTLKGGLKALARDGYDSHLAVVAAHFAEVPTAFAQVGDIMVLDVRGVAALGIDAGERIAVLQTQGLAMAPRAAAIAAYRVP